MTETEVFDRLQSVFNETFLDPVALTPQLSAHDVEEWDSFTQITLVVSIEKAFGIRFDVGEVAELNNVGEMAQLIQTKVANA